MDDVSIGAAEDGIEASQGRITDRRRIRAFRFHERRTGFDRRAASHDLLSRVLVELRDSPRALFVLLLAVNVMALLDEMIILATPHGAFAGSSMVAAILGLLPMTAAVLKTATVLGVSGSVWVLRRYRPVLKVPLLMFALFAAALLIRLYTLVAWRMSY